MKELLAALGDLAALERLNRAKLAEKIGLSRPNMISAFSGRQAMPDTALPRLRAALSLDERYRLDPARIHCLQARAGHYDAASITAVANRFATLPLRIRWLMRGVGELRYEGLALIGKTPPWPCFCFAMTMPCLWRQCCLPREGRRPKRGKFP